MMQLRKILKDHRKGEVIVQFQVAFKHFTYRYNAYKEPAGHSFIA